MTVGAGITGIGMVCTGLTTWLAWPHLGVALLGSLFLSLSERPSVGMRDAFLAVIGLQILAAIIVSALTCLLPDPRPRGLAQSRRRARLG